LHNEGSASKNKRRAPNSKAIDGNSRKAGTIKSTGLGESPIRPKPQTNNLQKKNPAGPNGRRARFKKRNQKGARG